MDVLLSDFANFDTLNIFSDASIARNGNFTIGCYGVVCVEVDSIIDKEYRLVSNTTSNNSELKGVRCALSLANKYKNRYRYINIFSDSAISIIGLREYINNWKFKDDGLLYTKYNSVVKNQDIFIGSKCILNELERSNTIIRLFHQSGHINVDNYNDLKNASNTFNKMNNINGKIDLNFIRYISNYNNYVDNTSRSLVRLNRRTNNLYIDPIHMMKF